MWTKDAQTLPSLFLSLLLSLSLSGWLGHAGPAMAQSAAAVPMAETGLDELLARVYSEHPELRGLRLEQQLWAARALQAGLGPNPELSLSGEDFVGSAAFTQERFTQFTLELAQSLPLGDRIERSRQLAQFNQQLAYWAYRVRLQELGAQVYIAYARLLALQAQQGLAAELIRSAQEIHALMQRAVAAGKLAPSVLLQSELEIAAAQADAVRLALVRQGELRDLALLWGGSDTELAALKPLSPGLPALETLRAQLVSHPRLARWDTERAMRQAALDVARAQGVPDLTLSGGLRYHPPLDWGAVLSLGLPLPFANANQGHIEEARLRQQNWEQERALEARQLLSHLTSAYAQLQAHHSLLGILREQVRLAGEQQQAADKAFAAGKTGYLEVLTAWRNQVQLRRQFVQAQGELLLAEVEVLTSARILYPQEALEPLDREVMP
ncbi:MAG: hypothetical protein CVV27_09390 [Candidatus Melainabacteria bacterium HGW-Melainabacteria-1]|nr:MAG: hypothetical protein CVV27_09390 [Candidatus Melainabacteria bacterium HGW-Melainabacteria-1]